MGHIFAILINLFIIIFARFLNGELVPFPVASQIQRIRRFYGELKDILVFTDRNVRHRFWIVVWSRIEMWWISGWTKALLRILYMKIVAVGTIRGSDILRRYPSLIQFKFKSWSRVNFSIDVFYSGAKSHRIANLNLRGKDEYQ